MVEVVRLVKEEYKYVSLFDSTHLTSLIYFLNLTVTRGVLPTQQFYTAGK